MKSWLITGRRPSRRSFSPDWGVQWQLAGGEPVLESGFVNRATLTAIVTIIPLAFCHVSAMGWQPGRICTLRWRFQRHSPHRTRTSLRLGRWHIEIVVSSFRIGQAGGF